MRVHSMVVASDLSFETLVRMSQKAGSFSSDIQIEYEEDGNDFKIDLKSILGTLLLTLRKGTSITIRTKGKDEEEAIHWISDTLERLAAS
ncbi:HPr family phosphocarrier protein [Paenibacillus sp. TRM 82003]|nr:HPr family phosphocarrier protein [Paenibacillus sp. TRM 82003]